MTTEERIALRRARSDAVQKFLDENADLFSPNIGEYDNEDDLDEESKSGIYVTGAMLIVRAKDMATGETEFNCHTGVPFGIGVTEMIGMLHYALHQVL